MLRRDARDFAARHDPDAARTVLDRQRRDRCAALFVDEATGMGVLNASFDPVSFALVRQSVDNYNDALWRQDGSRDGTPGQIRDNRQRLADSVFEMLTDRNALVTVQHPAARAQHGHSSETSHNSGSGAQTHSAETGPGRSGDAERNRNRNTERGRNGDAECSPDGDAVKENPPGRSVERWRPAQAPNQLVIIADIGVIDGTKPDGLCEVLGAGPVQRSILDHLSPDTRISGALFAGPARLLRLGRNRRHATAAQQLAIAIRDRGCVLCRAPMHRCKYHHIDEWNADNGATDNDNLAALCVKCHDDLHKNNQRLGRNPATHQWFAEPRTDTAGDTLTVNTGDTHRTNSETRTAPPSLR